MSILASILAKTRMCRYLGHPNIFGLNYISGSGSGLPLSNYGEVKEWSSVEFVELMFPINLVSLLKVPAPYAMQN